MGVLYARVGGAWQEISSGGGGSEEVEIGISPPTNPAIELWYDTDDPGVGFPNMPRGYVGHAELASSQTITAASTWTDITGVSVTWTADPSRRYKTTVHVPFQKQTALGDLFMGIMTGAGGTLEQHAFTPATSTGYGTGTITLIESGLSGSTTRKLMAFTATNGVIVLGATGARSRIIVEDIGAAGVSGGGVWSDYVPRGLLVSHSLATVFTTSGTHTTLQDEGLTVTLDEVTGRWYRAFLNVTPYTPGGVNPTSYVLLRNGVNIRQWDIPGEALGTNFGHNVTLQHVFQGATATGVIFKIQMRGNNNTSVASFASGGSPRVLTIEDIGKV